MEYSLHYHCEVSRLTDLMRIEKQVAAILRRYDAELLSGSLDKSLTIRWDSVQFMKVFVELENHFGVLLDYVDLKELAQLTVRSLAVHIQNQKDSSPP